MLNKNDLEQHDRIDAQSAVVVAVQIANDLIELAEIHSILNFTQKMILRYKTVYAEKLHLIPFGFVFFQHSDSAPFFYIIPQNCKKAQLALDFFDRLEPVLRYGLFCVLPESEQA